MAATRATIRPDRTKGFTLVEMLVTMLILTIGVALSVGVGTTVRTEACAEETRATQALVVKAIQAYRSEPDWKNASPRGNGETDSSIKLLAALQRSEQAREWIERLPDHVLQQNAAGQPYILDGFGHPLLYYRHGGLGGEVPLLVSRGKRHDDPADDIRRDAH